ncbi:MAG: hypothetical protein A3K19_20570 [Lentisphaerae bacterium RIFOXYB12_FULL_65_16]|nr:MAG: hypothetical protein A3K18_22160 [Lentisphaerae bacterium RIFOXYA12_64_32]OGV89392.1 MAG: hypothetical protein A3K19_20570 [Lentisphaerae bacterium RIFOXYB12_FULL_65_16]
MSEKPVRVDFSYTFATPHRVTVALPDSSDKTLLDLQPGGLRMAWTFDDLRAKPLAAFVTPKTEWDVQVKPLLDNQPFSQSRWTRAEGWLPVLVNEYGDARTGMRLEVVGGRTAAMVRVDVTNSDDKPHRFALRCERPGSFMGFNPAWVQPEWDRDVLLAGWQDRADRVLLLAIGGDEKPVVAVTTVCMVWNVGPGEKRTGWVVLPYKAYQSALPVLRQGDWVRECEEAKASWRALVSRAARISIPDRDVQNAFSAALADCFIMREPVAGGQVAACPGTECYRAPNSFEAAILAVLLDQAGLHGEAATGYQMCLDLQGADGNWNDPEGWGHYMWAGAGFKSWAVMEHYRLTGDKGYLAAVYPRMLASSRWQDRERARTRVLANGERPLTYGLMPRGMGDCGLKDDEDMYGVFLPHNIWAVFADAATLAAAEILGRTADLPELRRIHQAALQDLLAALDRGAVAENGYRWIPAVPGKTCGSRWGALNAAFPCGILPADHELITGTIRKVESRLSPGGIPVHTGWMKDGMWVAITLDNLAEVLLARDDGDAAAAYLYATLNHGTPLFSWCEERGQEPGAKDCSGDRQHLWTPIAVGRCIRDSMVMESGDVLHLARGSARHWLGSGQPLGVQDMPTHFGRVSYELRYDEKARRVTGFVEVPNSTAPGVVLHVRLPDGLKVTALRDAPGAAIGADGTTIEWRNLSGTVRFEAVAG